MANVKSKNYNGARGGWWIGLGLLLWPLALPAQVAVLRAVTAGGGGAAVAGPYQLTDTVGQAIAGPASSSAYTVNNGFWGTFGSPPAPYALVLTTQSNRPIQFPVALVLAGSDADGDPLVLSGLSSSSAQGGSVVLSANIVTYTPPRRFTGNDSFTYTIVDASGDSAVGTVSIANEPPGLMVTTTADAGPGSLRDALTTINAATPNFSWSITIAPSLAGQTISLSNSAVNNIGPSALVISNTVSISGTLAPGVKIALAPASAPMRLLFVASGANLTISSITLENGVAQGGAGSPGSGGGGGGAGLGGGIYNQGTVVLNSVVLSGNAALGGPGGRWVAGAPGAGGVPNGGGAAGTAGFGGGTAGGSVCGGAGGLGGGGAIFNDGGLLTLNNTVLVNNLARGGTGGAGEAGCNGTNQNGLGAGVFNYNGMAFLTGCLLTNNTADSGASLVNLGDGIASWVYLTQDVLTNAGSTNDFLSLSAHGGDAQTVETGGAFDSQEALWITPISDVGTLLLNHPLTVPVVLHAPADVANTFTVQVSSANTNVVHNDHLALTGSGTNYTLTLTPVPGGLGASVITVSAEGSGLSSEANFTAVWGLFGNITLSGGNRILTVTADPGLHCSVQYTVNLTSLSWITLGQATEITPGHYQYADLAPADTTRFYRIVVQ